jgi:hypothetical protein
LVASGSAVVPIASPDVHADRPPNSRPTGAICLQNRRADGALDTHTPMASEVAASEPAAMVGMPSTAAPLDALPPHCTLLGGTFALLVQAGLAASAIATLAYKRANERPRRPLIVWAFDASKQAFAGCLQHIVNLGFGVLFATTGTASECAWYLTNFTISVACGVFLLWAFMVGYKWAVDRYQLTLLRSGEYGSPPSWKPWLAQLLVWGFAASFEKVLTAIFVIVPLHRHLDALAGWMETPLRAYPALELILVMVLAPGLLNTAFFWVIDNLIMRKQDARIGDYRQIEDGDTDEPLMERLTSNNIARRGNGGGASGVS